MLLFAGLVVHMLKQEDRITITTAQCPNLEQKVEVIGLENGWECKKQGTEGDLLQPSGLWINQGFFCWKLKTPIEQFCKEEPEYCQH